MNKLLIMKQPSLEALIDWCIEHSPGITSERLWAVAKDWDHKLLGFEFEDALASAREKYRCTSKKWYPPNHKAEPKVSTGKKEDPRQVRMDW